MLIVKKYETLVFIFLLLMSIFCMRDLEDSMIFAKGPKEESSVNSKITKCVKFMYLWQCKMKST